VAARSASLEATLVDAVQQAVIATDIEGKVVFWNAFAERLFGWSRHEAIGRSILDLTPRESTREEAAAIMDRLTRGESWAGEFPVRRKDGSTFIAFVVNSPILDAEGRLSGVVGVSTDVSEQRALDARLRQASKMEAIGRLAGGVAHDFNNLLTVILGNVELLLAKREAASSGDACLTEIQDAAKRAASLTGQLLAFGRKQLVRPAVLELVESVRAMLPMLHRLMGPEIRITFEGEAPLHAVLDPGQLDQLLLNLVLNARDAMPEGGSVAISLASVADIGSSRTPSSAGFVRLRVRDDGTGIPKEALAHVFEPFFTTKEGKGTGLGLATVYGIVEQAGGKILVESSDRGSTFDVFLPRVASTSSLLAPAVGGAAALGVTRTSTVLLAEDEPALRALFLRVLTAQGHKVLAAENGEAAFALAEANAPAIDVLVTDLVMGPTSGLRLAEQVRGLCPGVPVILMTGYSEEYVAQRGLPADFSSILLKPFVTGDLVRAVARALASPRGEASAAPS
jgi:PAS domain S-box-containing protein